MSELYTFEAKITLQDGREAIGTVEAEDRREAKYFFGHFPVVIIDGKSHRVAKVDYRSVRKEREPAQEQ